MIQAWRSAWNEFVPFLEFPLELRKVVYTTDESVKGTERAVGGLEPAISADGLVAAGARRG